MWSTVQQATDIPDNEGLVAHRPMVYPHFLNQDQPLTVYCPHVLTLQNWMSERAYRLMENNSIQMDLQVALPYQLACLDFPRPPA